MPSTFEEGGSSRERLQFPASLAVPSSHMTEGSDLLEQATDHTTEFPFFSFNGFFAWTDVPQER